MSQKSVSRPPGRPKNAGKRAAIIDAAQQLFAANSYESVRMDEVANLAGVAKMTVYGHFRDKETLFEAVVRSTSDLMSAALPALPGSDTDVEEELAVFGQAFLGAMFSPWVISAMRNQSDMLSRNRALAERFYNAGPGRTHALLAAYLKSAAGWENPPPDQAMQAASDLMSLWMGDMQLQASLGLAEPITPDQIAQHVCRCTRIFLRGYGLLSASRRDGVQLQSGENNKMKATREAHASRRKQKPGID